MRVALISDIHGNHVALDAVLADIDGAGVDQVICLGDVATLGPQPKEVVQKVRDLGCPCILGNHDAFLLDTALVHGYTGESDIVRAVDWARSQLTEEDLDFVKTF